MHTNLNTNYSLKCSREMYCKCYRLQLQLISKTSRGVCTRMQVCINPTKPKQLCLGPPHDCCPSKSIKKVQKPNSFTFKVYSKFNRF